MKRNKVWVFVVLGLIIVLPLVSLWVMMKGADVRRAATHSDLYKPGTQKIAAYDFISQRGDTISDVTMAGKVCMYEFYSDSCYDERYSGTHPFFSLQEDYYGKTLSLRFISVSLTDSVKNDIQLQRYSHRYAGREMWHVVGGDREMAKQVFASCREYLAANNLAEENLNCPRYVFLADRQGVICGAYHMPDSAQYNAVYQDILFTVDKKQQ